MKDPERRRLTRYNLRTPLRFRALGVAADTSEHFTEALNVSRGGFFFASSAPLRVGMQLEVTLRMPIEVTGTRRRKQIARRGWLTQGGAVWGWTNRFWCGN